MGSRDNKPVDARPSVIKSASGQLVAEKDTSWTPTKNNIITTGVTALVTGGLKWFEIHTGSDIPAEFEIMIITGAVAVANYFTPTSLRVILGMF